MPITIVVGGQFGSEGKGKVAHWLANEQSTSIAVRVGGANSGHTAIAQARKYVLRQLPTPVLNGDTVAVIPAGAYIETEVLLAEIEELGLHANRLWIHPEAVIVDDRFSKEESRLGLVERIGSTGQGVGAAVATRVMRDSITCFARGEHRLASYVRADLPHLLNEALRRGERVLVEGTQGFGLSLLHSRHYPFCTSRDTTAAGALSEAGLSPMDVDCIALVIRAFPIRVAGNSGPLPRETTWQKVTEGAGGVRDLSERTTVTKRIRRIAKFHPEIVLRALEANHPSLVCLNHADYWDSCLYESDGISRVIEKNVESVEKKIGRRVDLVGTGPSIMVVRPSSGWRTSEAA